MQHHHINDKNFQILLVGHREPNSLEFVMSVVETKLVGCLLSGTVYGYSYSIS